MKHINPLHIGVFLIVLIIFVATRLASSKDDLAEAMKTLESTKKLSVELNEYKKVYSNGGAITKALERILMLRVLKSANLNVKKSKSGMSINSESMDKLALNSLMGKLVNGSYRIENLKIKKLSDEKVSFYTEIKW